MTSKNVITLIIAVVVILVLFNVFANASPACSNNLGIDVPSNCRSIKVSDTYEGVENFRPLTASSSKLRPNTLFRSDTLHKLSDADITTLEDLGLKTVIDLRSPEEIADDPNRVVSTVKNNYNFAIGTDPAELDSLGVTEHDVVEIKRLFIAGEFGQVETFLNDLGLDIEAVREERYREFASKFGTSVASTLRVLADSENYPIVFHCQGGKDRTGFVSAVILGILGEDAEGVLDDYLTTNLYTYDTLVKQYAANVPSLTPIYGAHRRQLEAALDEINTRYGSLEGYLRNIGITDAEVQQIRENLLVNA